MYKQMLHSIARYPNKQNWASQVKNILIKLNAEDVIQIKKFLITFLLYKILKKERVKLLFIQETNTRLNNSTRAVFFKHIYTFEYQSYLKKCQYTKI